MNLGNLLFFPYNHTLCNLMIKWTRSLVTNSTQGLLFILYMYIHSIHGYFF
jgi:hypothetical protein